MSETKTEKTMLLPLKAREEIPEKLFGQLYIFKQL